MAGSAVERASSIPDEVLDDRAERRARLFRRAGLAFVALFVLLGATGQFGVRSRTVSRSAGNLGVSLTYAKVARPALAVPYRLTITRAGGFTGPIEVRISTAYLAGLDENGTHPTADKASSDGDETVWTFDPPDGDVLVVWLDTRIEPGVQWRLRGATTVLNDGDRVTIDHPTWILP